MINEVIHFNKNVLKIQRDKPALLIDVEYRWLVSALYEELQEFNEAHEAGDLVGSVDGLLDIIYFAIGGLYRLGLNANQIHDAFATVHECNIRKKLGVKSTRPQDGTVADAMKGEDFVGPEDMIEAILDAR